MSGVGWAWLVAGVLWLGAAAIAFAMVRGRRP